MSKVLIVDDSRTNLAILSHLTRQVHEDLVVSTADHAAQAVTWLQNNTPDLIIADYNMPDVNGIEFTRQCRTLPGCSDVPIVMVTSARRRKVCLEALRAGATEFLNSPLDAIDFTSRIRRLLQLQKKASRSRLRTQNPGSTRDKGLLPGTPDWMNIIHVLDSVPVMVAAVSRDGRCLFVNATLAGFFDRDPAEISGQHLDDLPKAIREHLCHDIDPMNPNTCAFADDIETESYDSTGTRHDLLTSKRPITDQYGHVIAILTTSVDITARKSAEENLLYIAEHDSLTELPNRLCLRHHIEREIERCEQDAASFALLFIDVDRFKEINDSLGHDAGDRLLSTIADRLDSCISGPNFVARLGGDEFAVVIAGIDSIQAAAKHADKICAKLHKPMVLAHQEVRVSASIGIALYPQNGASVDDLLSKADLAMYRAKFNGGNGYHTSNDDDRKRVRRNTSLEADLRNAITRDELRLHYQPKVDLTNGDIIGAEALIRWQHPDRGLVSPAEFLPLAEESGLILPIGEWVLSTACRDACWWQAHGHPNVRVSVNISPKQFAKQSISDLVRSTLADCTLAATDLDIELTEQSMMRNTKKLRVDLESLRQLGAGLSLDDFGTGYASLSSVQNFPITELKIDRSFVKDHTSNDSDFAIVNAIISLGQSLKLNVVAEGVETLADAASLRNAGCEAAQGYYFSPPLALQKFFALLQSETPLLSTNDGRCA